MGKLFNLQTLNVDHNPITTPAHHILSQGPEKIVAFLRDRLEPPPLPPERKWISYIDQEAYKGSHSARHRVRVMAYNILADAYATHDRYAYCPTWALVWSYRRMKIIKEIAESKADLVCLQEIETGEFQDFFQEALSKHGYSGIFKPRSRAYTAGINTYKVDGCAIFYRTAKLALVQDQVIEFQRLALARHSTITSDDDRSGHERLLSRDNIAIVAVFELLEDKPPARPGRHQKPPPPQRVIVCNTHVHWNPELCDVKLMQTQMMMEELMTLRSKLRAESPSSKPIPMIVCGDFNSEPTSGVYELLSQGQLPPDHPEFGHYRYGQYSQQGLKHNIPLVSVYNHAAQGEPPFTNYTATYVGVLDYIFFSKDALRPCGVLEHVSEQTITSQGYALPSPHFPSDHLSLVAEFEIANN
jgi:CCR4-NOT transcription complex subunit 6